MTEERIDVFTELSMEELETIAGGSEKKHKKKTDTIVLNFNNDVLKNDKIIIKA